MIKEEERKIKEERQESLKEKEAKEKAAKEKAEKEAAAAAEELGDQAPILTDKAKVIGEGTPLLLKACWQVYY